MKPHIIVKLAQSAKMAELPHWTEILRDKSSAIATLHPMVDAVLQRFAIPVWATREYLPQRSIWSRDEVASGLDRVFRLVLQEAKRIPGELLNAISLLPVVEEARVGRIGTVDLPPLRAQQLSVVPDKASRRAIFLHDAQRYSRGNPEVVVAVLDTGISLDHPELEHALLPGRDLVNIIDGAGQFIGDYLAADEDPSDEVGHGTHVAGVISGKGIAMPPGVVPRCSILPVRVLAAMRRGARRIGAGLVENINLGLKWAIDQGADVINMSLGIRHTGGGLPHKEVIDYASRKGVTVVAASGNDGTDELYYPGAFKSVIAVGAMDRSGDVASFSSFGRQVSFIAPGEQIYSSYLNQDYAFASGTSHAAPFVAGAVALLKSFARSKGKDLSDRQVKHILKHTSDKIDHRFKDRKAGFGRLNLSDAMRLAEAHLS